VVVVCALAAVGCSGGGSGDYAETCRAFNHLMATQGPSAEYSVALERLDEAAAQSGNVKVAAAAKRLMTWTVEVPCHSDHYLSSGPLPLSADDPGDATAWRVSPAVRITDRTLRTARDA
jgi:hypothetical protein